MPKGPPPSWKRRDCRFDHLVAAAIDQGYGKVLVYSGIDSEERAHEIRRGIFRCAKHRGVSADAGRSVLASGDDMGVHRQPDGTFKLKYRIWDKRTARKSHIERHGADRQQWPYNPRRPATDSERESWANRDEHGRTVT
jgi:hypothetical protein